MDETYGTYVDDECFNIQDYDDDTDDVGRGNQRRFLGGAVQFTCGNKVTQGSKGYPCDLMIWARWRSGLRQGTLAIL